MGWPSHCRTSGSKSIWKKLSSTALESSDVLVLGCTHYPLLKPLLRRLVPAHVAIVDSADSTAQVISPAPAARFGKGIARGRTPGTNAPEILCDRFGGEISPAWEPSFWEARSRTSSTWS